MCLLTPISSQKMVSIQAQSTLYLDTSQPCSADARYAERPKRTERCFCRISAEFLPILSAKRLPKCLSVAHCSSHTDGLRFGTAMIRDQCFISCQVLISFQLTWWLPFRPVPRDAFYIRSLVRFEFAAWLMALNGDHQLGGEGRRWMTTTCECDWQQVVTKTVIVVNIKLEKSTLLTNNPRVDWNLWADVEGNNTRHPANKLLKTSASLGRTASPQFLMRKWTFGGDRERFDIHWIKLVTCSQKLKSFHGTALLDIEDWHQDSLEETNGRDKKYYSKQTLRKELFDHIFSSFYVTIPPVH